MKISSITQIDEQIEKLNKKKQEILAKQETKEDKIIYTKIPELGIEVSQQIYNDKTYADILKIVKEEQIVDSNTLFKLRKLTDKYPQFKNFWVFVPNPDKVSKDNNFVAVFGADSNWAILDCYWNPTDTDTGLGVFLWRKI